MLEIIVETVSDALAAEAGGATQLDLKSAFELGGLTPTPGMVEQISNHVNIDVLVMIRPHRKTFVFTKQEIAAMCKDMCLTRDHRIAGFLLGALTPQGDINLGAVKRFREAAGPHPLHFHLAWEQTKDPEKSFEQLIELGFKSARITGGQWLGSRAEDGIARIEFFQRRARGRIELVLARGVSPENIGILVRETGVVHAHAGGSVRVPANASGNVSEARVKLLRQNLDKAVALLD